MVIDKKINYATHREVIEPSGNTMHPIKNQHKDQCFRVLIKSEVDTVVLC